MPQVGPDGKVDEGGTFYMFMVYLSEAGLYVPALVYSVLILRTINVTCDTKAAQYLVLQTQIVSSLFIMVCVAPCVTEKISSDTYWRGLAKFHDGTFLFNLVRLHIIFECGLIVYGIVAVVQTNYDLCSAILPETVSIYLAIHGSMLLIRALHHIAFPHYVRWYSDHNPLPDVADKERAVDADKKASDKETVASAKARLERIRAVADANFHIVQQAWRHRERLPKELKDPARSPTKNKKVVPLSPTSIVVRPRSGTADSL